MSEGGENKSGLSAIIVAIGLILTTVANIAGIMQLKDVSATVIVIVLTAGAIVLALYALSERKRSKTTAIWLTAGAIFCAVIALGTMALSFFGGESGTFKGPGIFTSDTSTEEKPSQETERTNQPSSSGNSDRNTSSSPSTSTRPVLEKEITLWLDTGVDIDAADVKAVKAQAAVGSTDIVLKYYGNLDGTAQGF